MGPYGYGETKGLARSAPGALQWTLPSQGKSRQTYLIFLQLLPVDTGNSMDQVAAAILLQSFLDSNPQ